MNDSENMDFLAEPQEPQVEPVLQPEIVEPAAISPAVIEQEAVEPVAIEEPVSIETPMEEVAVEESDQMDANGIERNADQMERKFNCDEKSRINKKTQKNPFDFLISIQY